MISALNIGNHFPNYNQILKLAVETLHFGIGIAILVLEPLAMDLSLEAKSGPPRSIEGKPWS